MDTLVNLLSYIAVSIYKFLSPNSVCVHVDIMAAAINSCALVVSLMVCTTLFVSDISIGNRTVYCGIWDLSNALNRMRRSRMLFRAFQVLHVLIPNTTVNCAITC